TRRCAGRWIGCAAGPPPGWSWRRTCWHRDSSTSACATAGPTWSPPRWAPTPPWRSWSGSGTRRPWAGGGRSGGWKAQLSDDLLGPLVPRGELLPADEHLVVGVLEAARQQQP